LKVISLAQQTLRIVKGNHSRKTGAFVRACLAYCFITVPSMEDIFQRLHLYLLAAQVALQNHSIPQADALLKGIYKKKKNQVATELKFFFLYSCCYSNSRSS
jgi:hypothetical protein